LTITIIIAHLLLYADRFSSEFFAGIAFASRSLSANACAKQRPTLLRRLADRIFE
jgi:hypothetical protein